ncbi:beta-barrel assembly-enhancing protease [Imhoffiella purpurea]|uniref:Putative beta-barrel assembly-enhancing protease n=1 Tax=Imhoffiella purpurea TaxID=1249627 RepID=W9V139_9GAMM|nr:M48 family metalloprotease [Imhoffiella purpurea]EXJ13198.1 Peptidase M48, Ste24p [Imhoffiella purpurea]
MTTKPRPRIRRLLFAAGALAAVGLASPPAQAYRLPDMGSSADAVMSTGAEQRLGKAFMRSVRESLKVVDDPTLTSYIESLGQTLVAADPEASGNFTFFLIDEPVINAFAGPGGYIGVFAGLVLAAETESELAAVMAHEIAHVTQRHLMRGIEAQSKMTVPAMALLVAAAILGAQVSADAGAAAIVGVQAAALQSQINFTRDNEKEADRLGIATLANAGFDPYAMPGFFEKLSKSSRLYENNAPEFLRTHPVNSNRIADALGRADDHGARQRPDSLRFQLTRANLRQRSYSRAELSVAHFRDTLREGRLRSETAERYGYALALERAGQLSRAKEMTAKLLSAQPSQMEFVILDARLDRKLGKANQAVEHLRQAVSLSSDQWPLRVAYAEALLDAGRPNKAMDELMAVARLRPGNAFLYEMLERAAMKAGNRAATHRFRAEKLYAEGDLEPAIRQLEIALRGRDIPYHDAAQIQARLDAWKEEERDQKRQDKGGQNRR